MTVKVQRHLFTVEEFQRMGEAGIFHEEDRVELIEGEIVEMTPIGSRHAACVDRIAQILFERARGKAIVRVQSPVRLSERSEPQPDLGLLKRRRDFYAGGHPEPKDVLLLVEVTDTSQEFDRGVKVPLYAHSSIPEVWIVDLGAESVEIYTQPSAEGYRKIDIFKRGQTISCQSIAELKLAVDEILG